MTDILEAIQKNHLSRVFLLASPQLPQVKLQLLSLKNITISSPGLTRSGCNCSIKTSRSKLMFKQRINLGICNNHKINWSAFSLTYERQTFLALLQLLGRNDRNRFSRLGSFCGWGSSFCALLGHWDTILYNMLSDIRPFGPHKLSPYMGLVPLTEGSSVHLNDGALHQCVRPHKFVVGSVIDLRGRSNYRSDHYTKA